MQISGEPGLCDLHVSKAFHLLGLVGRVRLVSLLPGSPAGRAWKAGWCLLKQCWGLSGQAARVRVRKHRGWPVTQRAKCVLYRRDHLSPIPRTCGKSGHGCVHL